MSDYEAAEPIAEERLAAAEAAATEASSAVEATALTEARYLVQLIKEGKAMVQQAVAARVAALLRIHRDSAGNRRPTTPAEWHAMEAALSRVGLSAPHVIEFAEGRRCSFWFLKASALRAFTGTTPPRMQEIRRDHPDWLEQHTIDFDAGVAGGYVGRLLVISHCWEQPGAPDEQGVQFGAITAHLDAHPSLEWVWFDYWSMPQGMDKAEWEEAEFGVMLPNINLLYLFCSVLILLDLSYMSRFWTQFEAFLSMRKITAAGLEAAGVGERRASVACIHNAPKSFSDALFGMWSNKSAAEAHDILVKPDVKVTNQSDKDVQLPKLLKLESFAKQVMAENVLQS